MAVGSARLVIMCDRARWQSESLSVVHEAGPGAVTDGQHRGHELILAALGDPFAWLIAVPSQPQGSAQRAFEALRGGRTERAFCRLVRLGRMLKITGLVHS
jgi:hypothetical protein